MGVVQDARRLGQVSVERDIQHPAFGLTHFGQRDGRLARTGGAHHHHGRGQAMHCLLGVVEHDGFVQQFKFVSPGMQPFQRQGVMVGLRNGGIGQHRFVLDLGLV